MRRSARHLSGLAVLCLAATAPAARACPMCKDGVAVTSAPGAAAAPAEAAAVDFNTSIYVMLGVVAVVATAAGRAMVKAVRG